MAYNITYYPYGSIATYEQAADLFATARSKDAGKPIANNTRIVRIDNGDEKPTLAIRLHQTNVVIYYPDGRIEFNSGGWRTATTKDRINNYSPINIWQKDRIWYVTPPGGSATFGFKDGMWLDKMGYMHDADPDPDAVKKRLKLARNYAKGFVKALKAGSVPLPSNGDCFLCAFATADKRTWHETEAASGVYTGILSHIEEKYYVPSLLLRAMDRFGASIAAKQFAYQCMQNGGMHDDSLQVWLDGICTKQIERNIYRYVSGLLGAAV